MRARYFYALGLAEGILSAPRIREHASNMRRNMYPEGVPEKIRGYFRDMHAFVRRTRATPSIYTL